MKPKIAVYLAGTIKKDHEKVDESYWGEQEIQLIEQHSIEYEISFLNPAFRTDDLTDTLSVFGRDMAQVFSSNIVLVDARDRRGLGVGAEMMWAKLNKIPVITWAPRDTHYHKSSAKILNTPITNYVHPFVESLSDKIVENLAEAAQWIHFLYSDPSIGIKGIESIGTAMKHYKETQLQRDKPMQELLAINESLQKRIARNIPQVTV